MIGETWEPSATGLCLGCGVKLEPRDPRVGGRPRRYCSKLCAKKRYGRDAPSGTCLRPDCDKPLRARGLCIGHYKQAFMMRGRRGRGNLETQRKGSRTRSARRRAAERAPGAEKIELEVLGERDSWMCNFCGVAIDPELKYPDIWSASKDHVIPLAAGGEHTYANSQILHLRCNNLKAASIAVRSEA